MVFSYFFRKYCNNIFKDNNTCKELKKQISYKKSLKYNKLLDMYRKRYLSLASSVSHYGTEKAIERFENYKKDGAVMFKGDYNSYLQQRDNIKAKDESKDKAVLSYEEQKKNKNLPR